MRRTRQVHTIRRIPDARIRPATTMVCPEGHDFGLDKDRCARFYGRMPKSIPCPFCGSRVPVAVTA